MNSPTPVPAASERRSCLRTTTADLLRAAREENGMSQNDLAMALGVQQSRISKMERGEHAMTLETLELAAFALGLKVNISLSEIGHD